jgi:hypothetical protein
MASCAFPTSSGCANSSRIFVSRDTAKVRNSSSFARNDPGRGSKSLSVMERSSSSCSPIAAMSFDLWTGKTEKSARREIFYYDETDLMAVRIDGWRMHMGVKMHNNWFDPKSYPSVPYVVNLLMDPMEKITPDSGEFGYIGRVFFAHKLWAPTAAGPFPTAHLKSLQEFPPSQGADTLSIKKTSTKL